MCHYRPSCRKYLGLLISLWDPLRISWEKGRPCPVLRRRAEQVCPIVTFIVDQVENIVEVSEKARPIVYPVAWRTCPALWRKDKNGERNASDVDPAKCVPLKEEISMPWTASRRPVDVPPLDRRQDALAENLVRHKRSSPGPFSHLVHIMKFALAASPNVISSRRICVSLVNRSPLRRRRHFSQTHGQGCDDKGNNFETIIGKQQGRWMARRVGQLYLGNARG
jgi:hypothetical protein